MLDDLTEAQRFALTALLEVQPAATVGDFVSETDEGDFVTTYRFETTMTGYPGWNWAIAIADLPEEHPTIVESELLPADGALLAPDWIPWSDRMDDYRAAQLALGEAASEVAGLDDDDDTDDDDTDDDDIDDETDDDDTDDDDDDDDDLLGSDNLHSGDLDGVDIDEIDGSLSDQDALDGEELSEFDSELTPDAEAVLDLDELEEPAAEPAPRARRNRRASSK